jgi:opacity protein-like surface antigen
MKKLSLAMILLGTSLSVFASGAPVAPAHEADYFSGFYLGAGLGMSHLESRNTLDGILTARVVSQIPVPFGVSATSTVDADEAGKNAGLGEIFVGYGKVMNPWYVGVELFGRYSSLKPEIHVNDTVSEMALLGQNLAPQQFTPGDVTNTDYLELKNEYSFGGLIKAGYLLNPKTLFYILLGAEYSKFEVNFSQDSAMSLAYSLAPYIVSFTSSFSDKKIGLMPGIGIESMINDKLSVRAQYTYVSYGDIKKTIPVNVTITPDQSPYSYNIAGESTAKIHPSCGKFTIDLTYHFNEL